METQNSGNVARFQLKGVDEKKDKATPEYVASGSRAALESLITKGAKGFFIVAETEDGWEQISIPDSAFFAIGAISLLSSGLDRLLDPENISGS